MKHNIPEVLSEHNKQLEVGDLVEIGDIQDGIQTWQRKYFISFSEKSTIICSSNNPIKIKETEFGIFHSFDQWRRIEESPIELRVIINGVKYQTAISAIEIYNNWESCPNENQPHP